MKRNTHDADIIVVGGGLAGMTTAALLGAHGVRVICIDKDDPQTMLSAAYDARTTAISYGSRRVLQAAGLWDEDALRPCAIRDIHIHDNGSPVLLQFLHDDADGDDFGWIVDNRDLRMAMTHRLAALDTVQHIAPAQIDTFSVDDKKACVHLRDGRVLSAALIIGADGRQSFTRAWMNIPVRSWSYNQQAIVCQVAHEKPHNHIAVEHFMREGPLALLPMPDDDAGRYRSALVWSEHTDKPQKMAWSDQTFIAALQANMPDFYGSVLSIGKRMAYPLGLVHAYRYIGPRMALVADAAHGIHPIAGQGLNLGLRDIAMIAELIVGAHDNNEDIGSDDLLERYQQARRFDNTVMAAATDGLNRLFSRGGKITGLIRDTGLRLIQKTPAARRFFVRQAMAAPDSRWLPKLIREGKIR